MSLFVISPLNAHEKQPILLHAAYVFDGETIRKDAAVLVRQDRVVGIGDYASFSSVDAHRIELGNATLLPGLIELHAHSRFHKIPPATILQHGITTLRDLGGPLAPPEGGRGSLRMLSAGPILTAENGYPLNRFESSEIARAVKDVASARQVVRELVHGGAVIIKVALEPGGEPGAPWSMEHGHSHGHHGEKETAEHPQTVKTKPGAWPLLPLEIVKAIVDEAHHQGRKVIAHVAEDRGVRIAIKAGVDEWAHAPCQAISPDLLRQAVDKGVKIVSTIDTLSRCHGVADNVKVWAHLGGKILYGAEIAHPDIPWGIDAQELNLIMQLAGMSPLEVVKLATADAGNELGIPLLGRLAPEAPADLIAVRGMAMHDLKSLEYPDFIMSGGQLIVNRFDGVPSSAHEDAPHMDHHSH